MQEIPWTKVKGTFYHCSSFMVMQECQGVFKFKYGLNWKNIMTLSDEVNDWKAV